MKLNGRALPAVFEALGSRCITRKGELSLALIFQLPKDLFSTEDVARLVERVPSSIHEAPSSTPSTAPARGWWCPLTIPSTGKCRQDDQKFWIFLHYVPALVIFDDVFKGKFYLTPCLKKRKEKKKEEALATFPKASLLSYVRPSLLLNTLIRWLWEWWPQDTENRRGQTTSSVGPGVPPDQSLETGGQPRCPGLPLCCCDTQWSKAAREEKGLFGLQVTVLRWSWGRSMETGAEAEAMEECSLLARSLWLGQLAFFHKPGPPV